jgi:KDO2-lipid IV(A) lauroyltransferase
LNGFFARLWLALGTAFGSLVYLLGVRRQVALDGLGRAFPDRGAGDRKQLARAAYAQFGRSLAELAVVRRLSDDELGRIVRFDGWERYEAAAALGKGVVVAVGHFGNWELLMRACGRRGVKLTVLRRDLKDAWSKRLFAGRRKAGVGELLDKGVAGDAVALLRRGETLALAVDQNMQLKKGVFVDFFGTPACTTPAPAVLSLRTGAPLIAAFPIREADGTHRVLVEGPFRAPEGAKGHAAVVAVTQEVTRAVERVVRAHPDHWYWLHRRWKTRPTK